MANVLKVKGSKLFDPWDFTDANDGGFSYLLEYTNFWIRPDKETWKRI
jgi:hypothetical protein